MTIRVLPEPGRSNMFGKWTRLLDVGRLGHELGPPSG